MVIDGVISQDQLSPKGYKNGYKKQNKHNKNK